MASKKNTLSELLGREPIEGFLIDRIKSETKATPNRRCSKCKLVVTEGIFPKCRCNAKVEMI